LNCYIIIYTSKRFHVTTTTKPVIHKARAPL
jgi:hypothetical protein